jgi:hypothetical protein
MVLPEKFTYDVAISFAGEQRTEAEAIARCLVAAGVRVFYDGYEESNLWGKNLYDHLADVYQNKAQYCIILASEAYARKAWPTHERRSAQARALQEKQEYILPVRFDKTDIPGLAGTVGYLEYQRYGAQGICAAFLEKLGLVAPVEPRPEHSTATSVRALIWDTQAETIAYIPAATVRWGDDEVSLTLQPDDPTDGPFLNSLRGSRDRVIVGYEASVALCEVTKSTHISAGEKNNWDVSLHVNSTDFTPSIEMGLGNISADELAEMRGRRLLLNENPTKDTTDLNQITREILVAGQDTIVKVNRSPFPELYKSYKSRPGTFLEVAWVHAATMLKLSAVVEQIQNLTLVLKGRSLDVDFTGVRKKVYQNAPPHQVRINGACVLA